MKKLLLLTAAMLCIFAQAFAVNSQNWSSELESNPNLKDVATFASQLTLDEFLTLTPKKYRDYTGERLGVKNVVALKAAQKYIKSNKASDIDKSVYIILAILGMGWLGIGLVTDFNGGDWLVNLLLTILCWLPGVIHAFVKMDDYYG